MYDGFQFECRWSAEDSGIAVKTLKRAKKVAAVFTFKKDGRWFWSLEEGQE